MNETAKLSDGRILHLDYLRIAAICAVVVIHVTAQGYNDIDPSTFQWQVQNAYKGLASWAVPIFVMISGTLFLSPDKNYSIKRLYKNNILRLATIILTWGLIYALLYDRPANFSASAIGDFVSAWLLGANHMWFLYMLLGLYIFIPIFRCISKDKTILRYSILVLLILCILTRFFNGLFEDSVLSQIIAQMELGPALGFSLYFLLGYYLWQYEFRMPHKKALTVIVTIASIVLSIIFTSLLSVKNGQADTIFYTSFSPFVLLQSCGIYMLAKWKAESMPSEKTVGPRSLQKVSSCALGIYLVHIMVLNTAYMLGVNIYNFSPIISIPIISLISIAISAAVTLILQRIPIFNKYCI